ncbi:MAG TPA: hypothetical protein VL383_13915 [Gemmatimonadaceae bacterium]|nr:hypothetical protein [Gemmatimonadaceae bacterium]
MRHDPRSSLARPRPRGAQRVTASLALLCLGFPLTIRAQQPTPPPALDFSGVLFGNYSYRTDSAARAGLGGRNPNQFTIERAYLTFRVPAGENGQVRITTDIFQNTNSAQNSYYQGWAVRIKYAYLQYTGLKNAFGPGSSLLGRVGVLHNVVIDHEENFWPRYLSQVAVERGGFFSSADAGVAGLLTFGNKMGEIYGTITNGPGYTSFEKDRFKDLALRVSLTPFANAAGANAILKTFAVSPWLYKGWVGSKFASGGAGQIGPGTNGAVTEGMQRDRYGIFAGVRDRRLTAGAEWAQRSDKSEAGDNTTTSPRLTTDSTGRVLDGFVIARPLEWLDSSHPSNFGIVARFDHFTPNTSPTAASYAGTTPSYNFWILGASYDVTQRIALALDWQKQTGTSFPAPLGTNVRATPDNSTIFLHFQASF